MWWREGCGVWVKGKDVVGWEGRICNYVQDFVGLYVEHLLLPATQLGYSKYVSTYARH